jgi:hypothetical protein
VCGAGGNCTIVGFLWTRLGSVAGGCGIGGGFGCVASRGVGCRKGPTDYKQVRGKQRDNDNEDGGACQLDSGQR